MFYAQSVGLAKDVAYPLKPPSFQAIKSHPGKTWSYEPKALNETMLPIKRKKSLAISPTQNRTPHFNQRERMRTWEKKDTHTERKKTWGKLKESKLVKLD